MLLAYVRGREHPGKVRIFHWLSRMLVGGRLEMRHGSPAIFELDPRDYVPWAMVRTGAYEPESLKLALRLMGEEPGLFVDVGANFGLFTCAIATIPEARILSLEPDADNCRMLRRNVAKNSFGNVTIRQIAAGAKAGLVQLVRRRAGNSGTVAVRQAEDSHAPQGEWIKVQPLKDILAEHEGPGRAPILVKIDVEGFERQVLDGIDLSGAARPRHIIFEYVPEFGTWQSFEEMRAYFAARAYHLTDVRGRPITDAREILEYNIWARAVEAP